MANDNSPRGLVPLNWPKMPVHYYKVDTAADIFLGEPVVLAASGFVVAGSITGYIQYLGVAVGFAGVNKAGIAADAPFLDVSAINPSRDGVGDRWIAIADDPQQEFVIQEDTGGTALVQADAGAAVDLIYRGGTGTVRAGDANTGWASLEIDASTVVVTASSPFQLLRFHDIGNTDGTNNGTGDFAKWIVRILNHQKNGLGIPIPGPIV